MASIKHEFKNAPDLSGLPSTVAPNPEVPDLPGVGEEIDELEDEQDLIDLDNPSDDDTLPAQHKKRARPSQSKPKAPRKKYVRGKQGGLQSLMKMPIDIFTEIAYHLAPGDLVVLIRSNKFFRKMLLQRSSIQLWRRAESNVPGLPPCPPGMYEPQYAALIFSKSCTLCGATATAKPDPNLRVRLCASCRDTKLRAVDWRVVDMRLVSYTTLTKSKVEKSWSRSSGQPSYSLSQEVDEVIQKPKDFLRAGDQQGLKRWQEDKCKEISERREHAKQLLLYLNLVDRSRGRELDSVKLERRAAIVERLKALEWTDEDMRFYSDDAKQWSALVDIPKPLTDRIWTNLLPKLIPILEENRKRNLAYAKEERRVKRRACMHRLLMQMKRTLHPFKSMLDALGIEIPPLPTSDDFSFSSYLSKNRLALVNPFPETHTVLEWECLRDLCEREISVEEVESEYEERIQQVEQAVLEWRTDVEQQLVSKFEAGNEASKAEIVVTVKDSTDSTAHLSRGARFLLRADTVFKRRKTESELDHGDLIFAGVQQTHFPEYYPRMVSSHHDTFHEYPFSRTSESGREEDLDLYERYTGVEKILKSLLRDLGMPDVARVELEAMSARFACGRCSGMPPNTWEQMVQHYISKFDLWERDKDSKSWIPIRHPVIYKNLHDLEPSLKPLARLLTEEEAGHMSLPAGAPIGGLQQLCRLCTGTGRGRHWANMADMLVHLQEVHEVVEPVKEVHYGQVEYSLMSDKWQKQWDDFHDNQASAPAAPTLN